VSAARVVAVGLLVYAAIDTALVFLRPQFSILHSAESDYGSLGSWDWLMSLNFLLRGLISFAAVRAVTLAVRAEEFGQSLRLGLRLLTGWAGASALLAFFPDDPAGTPARWHGDVHLALAFIAFICVLIGAMTVARALRSIPRWRTAASALTALAWAALIPLLLLGHAHLRPRSIGGLYEKIFLAIELLWLLTAAGSAALMTTRAGLARAHPEPLDR
jgi:hypothetical protein